MSYRPDEQNSLKDLEKKVAKQKVSGYMLNIYMQVAIRLNHTIQHENC